MQTRIALAVGLAMLLLSLGAYAADACKRRGELDTMYCDDNNDLVADAIVRGMTMAGFAVDRAASAEAAAARARSGSPPLSTRIAPHTRVTGSRRSRRATDCQ